MKESKITDRYNLEFKDYVFNEFNFLVEKFNFYVEYFDNHIVKYYSDKVFVNVYYERLSYEIYFCIGMLPESKKNYKISSFEISSVNKNKKFNILESTTNPELISKVIIELANMVKSECYDILLGNLEPLKHLYDVVEKNRENLKLNLKLIEMEREAQVAWNEKNYRKLISIYTRHEKYLTKTQSKKLEYARKKIILSN